MNRTDPSTREAEAPWTTRVDRVVGRAAREVRLLGAVTPIDAERERARLVAAFEAGRDAAPRWEYAKSTRAEVHDLLASATRVIANAEGALARAYAARIAELDLEAAIAEAAGTASLAAVARERYATRDPKSATAASELAQAWIAERATTEHADTIRSDGPEPRSLLSRMRAAVGARRLPFSVVVHDGLAPLAATGERTILVAAGRDVTDEDVARTVLHEIEGHAVPRRRATAQSIALFAIGTARGADEQEGYALLREERADFLRAARRRQLAARHLAVEAMLGGASFVDAARTLIADHGVVARDAVLASERAFRGSDGVSGGLGRERVYIEALLRVRARIAAHPDDEAVIASGQIAVDAIDAVRVHVRIVAD